MRDGVVREKIIGEKGGLGYPIRLDRGPGHTLVVA
jgi:hypothetical protein